MLVIKLATLLALSLTVACGGSSGSTANAPGAEVKATHAECEQVAKHISNLVLEEAAKQGIEIDEAKKEAMRARSGELVAGCEADMTHGMVECTLKANSAEEAMQCDG